MFNTVYKAISVGIGAVFFGMYLFGKDREKKIERLLVAIFCLVASQI
ncbi:MAG: hypothetical protein A4E53_01518 [Pelotomaculum sp. PtaB.Bin104]|nr:MAG: hypothetical protein A4E53_01518 [Pelotomaculum sp. PtaB.Bin104]